jgi:hypothetical protein
MPVASDGSGQWSGRAVGEPGATHAPTKMLRAQVAVLLRRLDTQPAKLVSSGAVRCSIVPSHIA